MSEETEQGLDFSMVIASTVHDMKNSLATLTGAQRVAGEAFRSSA